MSTGRVSLRQTLFVPPVPLVVAETQGFLDDAGLALTTTLTRSSHEQRDQLMSGAQDVAVTAIDNLIVWNDSGCDIRMIAQVEQTTALGLYVDPRVTSIHALAGRRFAVDAAANGFAVAARHLLASQGIDNVEFIEVGGVRERLVALREGTADAALLGPPLDELAEQAGFVKLTDINALVPDFPGQGLMVRESRMPDLAEPLARYVGSLARAVEWTEATTEERGSELLQANGFAGRAATTAWLTRPTTLGASLAGLELLVAMRRDLGLLPAEFRGIESLWTSAVLTAVETAR